MLFGGGDSEGNTTYGQIYLATINQGNVYVEPIPMEAFTTEERGHDNVLGRANYAPYWLLVKIMICILLGLGAIIVLFILPVVNCGLNKESIIAGSLRLMYLYN